jgi:hypothetical protein
MSTHRLDTARLMRDVDRARRAGSPDEMSYRQIADLIGVRSSVFTRLSRGDSPTADSLCSLLMWLNPRAPLAEYTLAGDRRTARPPAPRRDPLIAPAEAGATC